MHIYLGNKNYSSWSLRAWLVIKHSGAAFAETVIPLDQANTKASIRADSPSGRVPVLTDGDVTIWESLAIAEYLAERFPAAQLWPRDASERAVARAVSHEMHAGFGALRTYLPMDVRARYQQKRGSATVDQDIRRIIQLWTDCRTQFGGGDAFLFGPFTIADAMYAPVVSRFVTYGIDLDGAAASYCDAVWNWPAMQEWVVAAEAEPWVIEASTV